MIATANLFYDNTQTKCLHENLGKLIYLKLVFFQELAGKFKQYSFLWVIL